MSCSSFAASSMCNPAITPIKTVKLNSLSSTALKSSPWKSRAARINPLLPLRSISPTVSRSTPCATPSGVTGRMEPLPTFHYTWHERQKNCFDKATPHTHCEELSISSGKVFTQLQKAYFCPNNMLACHTSMRVQLAHPPSQEILEKMLEGERLSSS